MLILRKATDKSLLKFKRIEFNIFLPFFLMKKSVPISENTGKCLLRYLAYLTNMMSYTSQREAFMNNGHQLWWPLLPGKNFSQFSDLIGLLLIRTLIRKRCFLFLTFSSDPMSIYLIYVAPFYRFCIISEALKSMLMHPKDKISNDQKKDLVYH